MRILHLISQRPEATGSGVSVRAMIAEAAGRGHESYLVGGIASDPAPAIPGLASDSASWVRFSGADLPFSVVGMSDVMPYESKRFRDLTESQLTAYESVFENKLREAVERFSPHVIHANHLWIATALVRRVFPDLPIVATSHGSDLRQFRTCPRLADRVRDDCTRLNGILTLSRAHEREVVELYGVGPDQVHVVGAGFDRSLFFLGKTEPAPPVEIVFAGKLSRAKGVPWLLRALLGLRDLPWRLHLVGSGTGEEENEVLNLARGMSERVQVYGQVPQSQLAELLRRSHVFVLPSFYEGLPLVVIEALACGCRAIVTELPGVMEMVGAISRDVVELVPLPRLVRVDVPREEDEKAFEDDLACALSRSVHSVLQASALPREDIEELLGRNTWSAVFERIERVYHASV